MVKNDQHDFNAEECRLKHELIHKDIQSTNEKIRSSFEEIVNHQRDLKEDIKKVGDFLQVKFEKEIKDTTDSLKNKIILTEKSMGDKLDILDDTIEGVDESLKGNGEPGLKEKVRLLESKVKWNFIILGVMMLLLMGGEFWGVTAGSIRKYFFPPQTKEIKIDDTKEGIDDIHKNIHKITGEEPIPDKKSE